jgi:squalene synthase HpnC
MGTASTPSGTLAVDQHRCLRQARTHYENFTVLSPFASPAMRRHLAALYTYCRTIDDLGDEAAGNQLALLDDAERELDAAYAGNASKPGFVALQHTIDRFALPRAPFVALIDANRRDQTGEPFDSYEDLLEYCALSANPVGRLVLMIYGHRDRNEHTLSDATCTALQLTNFWQDLRRDTARGRLYLPRRDMKAYSVRPRDLHAATASEPLRQLMAFQVDRTRALFDAGLPLLRRVRGHLRIDLALFTLGGSAILDKIQRQGFDTLARRPTLSSVEKLRLVARALRARR